MRKVINLISIFLLLTALSFAKDEAFFKEENIDKLIEYVIRNEENRHKKIITVKLSYTNPKIVEKNGVYYVNNKPYRGKVYIKNNMVLNEVLLEQYLYSVVSAEMPTTFGMEPLKAQSVAARTYALFLIENNKYNGFDLYDTVKSQVYKGMINEKEEVIEAVNDTYGEIITYDDKPILAVYHSSSGDKTSSSKEVFGREYKYLVSVEDFTASTKWSYKISKKRIEKIISKPYKNILKYSKNTIRKMLGVSRIRSNNFNISFTDNHVVFYGLGYGHGVGLSQYGAKYLFENKNYTYKQILEHYYTNTSIRQIGENNE